MDSQFKKGILEMCVLFSMQGQDRYGYEIMKTVRQVFPDVYDGSIYTILRRLSGSGYIEAYLADVPSGGPSRKYYRLTPPGAEYTAQLQQEWHQVVQRITALGI